MLDDRKAAILAALVEDHIATGAPVSSRAVLERSGLACSTATIRNEFVVLEQDGLIAKPYTSAGRVPTDRGYRYYVDHLSPGALLDTTRDRIDSFFSTVQTEVERILRETTELLSEITHYPAVVVGPGLRGHEIRDVRLLGVEPGVVLQVLVTDGGRVHQSLLRLPVPLTPREVDAAQEVVEATLAGTVLTDDIPDFPEAPAAADDLLALVADSLADAASAGRDVYIGGTSRMVDLWEDLAKLHRVLGLLERETSVASLLDGEEPTPTVRIGTETGTGEDDLAIVAASYRDGLAIGRMGVLGPLRMDYRRTIKVIEEVSEALGDSLETESRGLSMPDYYEALGVARDATQDEIKKAFRKLARETHPDSNHSDPEAEHRFREVAEAYEVLSDPNRRAAYDRGGSFDPSDLFSSFGGIDEVLSRFFGGGFGFGGGVRGPAQGDDVGVIESVTLEEAATGVDREVSFAARVTCETCSGSGSAPGVDLETCERCAGQGSVRVTRQTMLGATMSIAACDRCRGRGRTVVEPCPDCAGAGSLSDTVTLEVAIPPGVEDGTRIRLAGKGQAGDPGGRPGDLFVQVAVAPDSRFERHGADLLHRAHVGLAEATLGTSIEVPVVADDALPIDIPAGTQPGTVFKLSRRGMPRLQRRGRGDLLVEVVVEVPEELSAEAEVALRSYAELAGEEPVAPKRSRRKG